MPSVSNVAMPATVATVSVPDRVAPDPPAVPIATVTLASAVVTTFPTQSSSATRSAGVIDAPAVSEPGASRKTSLVAVPSTIENVRAPAGLRGQGRLLDRGRSRVRRCRRL